MLMTFLCILFAALLGVVGQLMLKQGMVQLGTLQLSLGATPNLLWKMGTSAWIVCGLLVFGVGTFFWLLVLNRVPLSYSYPFTALGTVLGTLAAWGVFREDVPPLRWIGLLVVCAGMLLVAKS